MSGLISNLPDEITKGITLNYQHIDLFTILDNKEKSDETKKVEVIEYLKKCKEFEKVSRTAKNLVSAYTAYVAEKLGIEDVKKLETLISGNLEAVFDRKKLIKTLAENGYQNPEQLNDTFMEATDVVMNRTKEGITSFLVYDESGEIDENKSFKKVTAFYSHVISGEYNRIDFDDIASPTSYMAIQPDFVRPRKLKQALTFCDNHNLSAKINSAFFYLHSHYPESIALNSREELIKYYETYFNSISEVIDSSSVESYDIFNEFVYRNQPQIVQTQSGEEIQYGERHNGIHSILKTEDFCNLVKKFREKNPNLEFVYNDDGWEIPEKREGIFRKIEEIINNEDYEGQLVNAIGMQFHTSVNIDISQIRKAVIEARNRFPNLNINITELDITKNIEGFDYRIAQPHEIESAQRIANFKQKQIMNEIKKLADNGDISELTFWSQSDEMAFRGNQSSMVNYNSKAISYSGKNIEYTEEELLNYKTDIEIVARNIAITLARQVKSGSLEGYKKLLEKGGYMREAIEYFETHQDEILTILQENEIEPVQPFNLHTHTMRCGHAGMFTEDFEYVHEAIKSGMKTLAFTDHAPFPQGQKDSGMRMDYEELEDYLASVKYLRQEYKGVIDIKSGFEFEYIPELEEHLLELKSKSDYMILGQHFVIDENDKKIDIQGRRPTDIDLELYAQSIETAVSKGIPDIIAHPDIYLRSSGKGEADYHMTEKEREIAERICQTCADNNIPIEMNMGEILRNGRRIRNLAPEEIRKMIKTPSREFWKIAVDKGCRVLFGKDAHNPNQISEDRDYEIARILLGDEIFRKLDFMTLADVAKTQSKVSIEEVEEIASSTNVTELNQATNYLREITNQREDIQSTIDD